MATSSHVIIDDFLPGGLHGDLLDHVLALENFESGSVLAHGKYERKPDIRQSRDSSDNLGPFQLAFSNAVRDRFGDLCRDLGITTFPIARFEILLAAYGDGDFYAPHKDTFIGSDRLLSNEDRILTLVYYLHRRPRVFEGGALKIYPLGNQPPVVIEPVDNRLVAFPSFMVHEVLAVSLDDKTHANSRFSVNCWLNRARPDSRSG